MEIRIGKSTLRLIQGDITDVDTDAIVNPANTALQLGGGVAGAIRRKGGSVIQQECDRIGGTYTGGAVITTGGNLKAGYVIHATGPVMGEGDEDNKLRNATLNSLKVAEENGLKSICFPAISTGIFGYPIDRCAKVMLNAVIQYLRGNTGIETVLFCLYTPADYEVFKTWLMDVSKGG